MMQQMLKMAAMAMFRSHFNTNLIRPFNERAYDFGYGMNWKGIIKDARTSKYISIPKPVISANGTLVTIANLSQTKVYYSIDNSSPAFIENNLYSKPFTVKQAG